MKQIASHFPKTLEEAARKAAIKAEEDRKIAEQRRLDSALMLLAESMVLLSFISRHHLEGDARIRGLKEVPVKGAAMRRRIVVTHRSHGFLSPASRRLLELFEQFAKQA